MLEAYFDRNAVMLISERAMLKNLKSFTLQMGFVELGNFMDGN